MNFYQSMRNLLRGTALLLVAVVPLMTGCKNFFIPVCQAYNTCTTTTTTTTTTPTTTPAARSNSETPTPVASKSYMYVANAATGKIGAYSLTSGHLKNLTPSAYSLHVTPSAVAATPSGKFLYVATAAGSIYVYDVAGDGSLKLGQNGNAVAKALDPTWMSMDRAGNWLFVASSSASQIQEFRIDPANGSLQPSAQPRISLDAGTPTQVYVRPDNKEVFIALGVGGVDAATFDANTGAFGALMHTKTLKAGSFADNVLTSGAESKHLFIGEKGAGIRVMTIGNGGGLQEVSGSPFASQHSAPSSLVVDSTNSHLLAADLADKTITGFRIGTNGSLVEVSREAFSAAGSPTALSIDPGGKYALSLSDSGILTEQTFSFTGNSGATSTEAAR